MSSDSSDSSDDDIEKTHPLGSTWQFSWTSDYVVTVTGHTRRGIRVNYRKPGSRDSKHTLKAGIYQPEELVPLVKR